MKTKHLVIGFLSGLVGGVFVLGMYLFAFNSFAKDNSQIKSRFPDESAKITKVKMNSQISSNLDFTFAAEKGMPAVVHIKTQYNQPNYTLYDFIFGTQPRNSTHVSTSGSGVIISSDGYIVTNNHVIENAEIIEIVLNNKKSYPGKIIGRDSNTDLALLKIDATDLPYLDYGNSDDLKIGEWVLAIGNPFNLTSTVTAGIVSAKARTINSDNDNLAMESFIQTDAAVNPGNSGGALINTNGELVGINSAIASQTGSFIGYSFAIPVNIVRKIVADLVEFGEVQRAYLGLDLLDIDAQVAEKYNVSQMEGVYIEKVWSGSSAEKAGIKSGDIIAEINNVPVNSTSELLDFTSRYRPGEEIALSIKSGKNKRNVKLLLQNKYGNSELIKSDRIECLGAKFESVSDHDKNRLRIKNGIQITDISAGKVAASGIRKGFIIVRANNQYVNSVAELEKIMKSSDGALFVEGIYPNGMTAYYAFKID